MPKYSPEPPHLRRKSDGALSIQHLSPHISSGGSTGISGQTPTSQKRLIFEVVELEDLNIDILSVGQSVNFKSESTRMSITIHKKKIGYVPQKLRGRIKKLIAKYRYTAWISDISDKKVEVTIEW